MAGYFVDTSALVKRYVQEVGSPWVRSLTRGNTLNRIYLARITAVEITAAIARRRKGRTLTSPRASSILYRFRKHLVGRYTIVEVTPDLLTEAMKLANSYELRAYDAVQLAVAIEVNRIYKRRVLALSSWFHRTGISTPPPRPKALPWKTPPRTNNGRPWGTL